MIRWIFNYNSWIIEYLRVKLLVLQNHKEHGFACKPS